MNLKIRQSIGQLKAYKTMYFARNISENKDGKKMRAVIRSCVKNGEFHFNQVQFGGISE